MDKFAFFIKGLQNGKYRDKSWVLRVFALVRESKKESDLKPLDILQSSGGFSYLSPETIALAPFTGAIKAGEPLLSCTDEITVKKGEIPGFLKDETTTVGRLLYHCIVFVYPFGDKVPFYNGRLDMSKFEDELASKLEDDVEKGKTENAGSFYCRELVRYYEAVAYSRTLAMLFVPAASQKSLSIAPEVLKRRDELFNDPNIDMDDQATAAAVEAELVGMDKASFKGDTASGFFISGKAFAVIRKRRFISFGSGDKMVPGTRTKYVRRSLDEGIDTSMFKEYVDEMRTGSYKRGVETMFGGELDKWLVRQSSNMRVIPGSCGTMVGMPTLITEFNKLNMLGRHIVVGGGYDTLTEDNIGTYLGKKVLRRSPATCRQGKPDYCEVCLGAKLSMNPDAISVAFSQYGHAFMGESMSAMHGKSLSISVMDFVAEAS